jgi:hypothetical protein
MYNHVTPADVAEIVSDHLELGRPVRRLIEGARERARAASDSTKQTTTEKDGDT